MKNDLIVLPMSLLDIIMDMSVGEAKTVAYLLKHYHNGSVFHLTREIRLLIAKETKLKERSIYNIIPLLEERQIIVRVNMGRLHKLNPKYSDNGILQ